MIVDASAILAIVLNEAERKPFAEAMNASDARPLISPINLWEVFSRLNRIKDEPGRRAVGMLIEATGLQVHPADHELAEVAIEAQRRFGRGNHPAGLNMGDCFAYALARTRNEPLLFKGDDFRKTDVKAAL